MNIHNIGVLEEIVLLILEIDSWYSSRPIIPFRWTGYVESNSALQHPAEKATVVMISF
jgi:hypothetical protein